MSKLSPTSPQMLRSRWLACLLAAFMLLAQLGAMQHALSHLAEVPARTQVAPQGDHGHVHTPEQDFCLECAAFCALAVALPALFICLLRSSDRWFFHAAPIFQHAARRPVLVRVRGPPALP